MLCDSFGYILKLEETVKDNLSHDDNMEDECYEDSYLSFAGDMWKQFGLAGPSTSAGEIQPSPSDMAAVHW